MYDIKIVGGTIIDGSGTARFHGDVGITGGLIRSIGSVPGPAATVIDAHGRVVCPGFVDIHTHYDAQVLWDRHLTVSPWHGVTTAVIGNCGFGIAPTRSSDREYIMRTLETVEGMSVDVLRSGIGATWPFESFPDYLTAIERAGTSINIAVLAGHTPLRMYVMGLDSLKREANETELAEMKSLLRGAMQAGAIGFATSRAALHYAFDGYPVPSRSASLRELEELFATMAEFDRGIMQVSAGPDIGVEEMGRLSTKYGRPISWAALLANPGAKPGALAIMDKVREARRAGAAIWPQVSCRPLQFDFSFREPYPFGALPLFEPIRSANDEQKKAIYADPDWRTRFRGINGPGHNFLTGWEERTVVSINPCLPETEGLPLSAVAREMGKTSVDFVLDTTIQSNMVARFRLDAVNFDEIEVAALLQRADCEAVLGLSDAGAHADQLCDACYSTHLLGYWVREKDLMPLERAINILTKHPADVFGIADRGLLAPGWPADVVVFDPETVSASKLRRTHDLPGGGERLVSDASGIDAVLVNGSIIRKGTRNTVTDADALPGKLLRQPRSEPNLFHDA